MYLSHFGLNEAPFRITPHTDFFFAGANRGATLEALSYAITQGDGIVKVTGEVGSGKTMLCRVLIERLPPHVESVYLANPSLSRDDIVRAILTDLDVTPPEGAASQLIRALQETLIARFAEGRRVVLLIDEAHAMPLESLEEIRLLSNLESQREKLLQIALFGQQELDDHLGMPQMRPLKERIVHRFELEPLVRDDVGSYLMFRMRQAGYKGPDLFNAEAVKLIASTSQGLTRRVNILADKALLAAFSDGQHQVTASQVRAAVADSEFRPARPTARALRWPMLAGGALGVLALGTLMGVGIVNWLHRDYAPKATGNTVALKPAAVPGTVTATAKPAAAAVAPVAPVAPVATPVATPVAAPVVASAVTPAAAPAVPVAVPAPAPTIGPAAPAAPKPTPAQAAAEPAASCQQWIAQAPESAATLQLMISDAARAADVNTWIDERRADLDAALTCTYASTLKGSKRISVIYGRFEDRDAAQAAITKLPTRVSTLKPLVRTAGGIRKEIGSAR